MENANTKRATFLQKLEHKSAVKFKHLSPSKNLIFFNSNSGSRMEDTNTIDFVYSETDHVTKVCEINEETAGSVLSIVGYFKWLKPVKTVIIGSTEKQLREALFADATGSISITVWGELVNEVNELECFKISKVIVSNHPNYGGLKLQTTSSTQVVVTSDDCLPPSKANWNESECKQEPSKTNQAVTGNIVSCSVQRFKTCNRMTCKKKVNPMLGELRVVCSSCGSKMLVSMCKESLKINLLIDDVDSDNQIDVVLFQNVLLKYFDAVPNDDEGIEDYFLNLTVKEFELKGNVVVEIN